MVALFPRGKCNSWHQILWGACIGCVTIPNQCCIICSSEKVNVRQLVRSSLTSAGLAANTMRSIFSIAGPHALHGKVAPATDSPLLAGLSSVGAATLNAAFLETAFVTRTPAYASLRYAHVLKTSALPLAGCYFLRETPYMIALLGLPDDMSLSKKLLVTACLAGASFFRMLLPEAYLTDDFVIPSE